VKRKRRRLTRRFIGIPRKSIVKINLAPNGNFRVVATEANHNYQSRKSDTTYAVNRKQDHETINLILKTVSIAAANSVQTVMQVSYVFIHNVILKHLKLSKDMRYLPGNGAPWNYKRHKKGYL
jgi:hypothetical protein